MTCEDVLKIKACTSDYFKNLEIKDSQTLYLVNSGTVVNDVPITDMYYGGQRVKNVSVVDSPPTENDNLTSQRFYLLKQDDKYVKLYFKYSYKKDGVVQTKVLTALDLGIKIVDNSYEISTDILFEDNTIARLLKVSESGDLPDEIVNTLVNGYDLYSECSLLWRTINPEVVISRFDKIVASKDTVSVSGTGNVVVTVLDFESDSVLKSLEVSLTSSLSSVALPVTSTPVKFKLQETLGSQLQGFKISGTSVKGLRIDCKNLTLLDLSDTNLFDLLITNKCTELSTVNLVGTKVVEKLGRLITIVRELPSRTTQGRLVVGDISSSTLDTIKSEADEKNWNIITNI